ncbi:protein of unknown function [Candidatus Nitrospira inopinata]|uniref:Uncharacterized protein n=1 Tax=Candidatus Nitrospira inopinata TaxID=1715989 RepID=A0A0S4KNW4_9BACT|nr:protein of unknown function [Candidatus Nitrospira inopinata]
MIRRTAPSLTLPPGGVHVKMPLSYSMPRCGEVREWTNRRAWRARVLATGPWVRIPPSPPNTACSIRSLAIEATGFKTITAWEVWFSNRTDGGVLPVSAHSSSCIGRTYIWN